MVAQYRHQADDGESGKDGILDDGHPHLRLGGNADTDDGYDPMALS